MKKNRLYVLVTIFIILIMVIIFILIRHSSNLPIYQLRENTNVIFAFDENLESRFFKVSSLPNDTLEFKIKKDAPAIWYVGYKVNEQVANVSNVFPYTFTLDHHLLHPGVNEVKVVIYYTSNEIPKVQTFYINYLGKAIYPQKAQRSGVDYPKDSYPIYETSSIPVLMYHKFLDTVSEEEQSIAVSTSLFEKQLERLLSEGYTPINFYNLDAYLKHTAGLPEKPILITTDDGYLCNYEKAYPLLKKYNAQATFFVATQHVGVSTSNDHFSWEQAKKMEASGLVDIQSHTHHHARMSKLREAEVKYEIALSFDLIQKKLGLRDVKVLAYPEFRHHRNTQQWVTQADTSLQVTSLAKKATPTTPLQIKRLHISNEITPDQMITLIEELTFK